MSVCVCVCVGGGGGGGGGGVAYWMVGCPGNIILDGFPDPPQNAERGSCSG